MANGYLPKPQGQYNILERMAYNESLKANEPTMGDKSLALAASALNAGLAYKQGRDELMAKRQEEQKQKQLDRNVAIEGKATTEGWTPPAQHQAGMGFDPNTWTKPEEKPQKPTEASEWYSEDLSNPEKPQYFYNQVVRDAKGLRTEKVPTDKQAYEHSKGRTPQARPDIVDKPTETQVRLAGYSVKQDANGGISYVPKPPAQAKASLMALRNIYRQQGNTNGVDYIDAELSQYGVPAIGTAKPETPTERAARIIAESKGK